jgi:hypothetical protein
VRQSEKNSIFSFPQRRTEGNLQEHLGKEKTEGDLKKADTDGCLQKRGNKKSLSWTRLRQNWRVRQEKCLIFGHFAVLLDHIVLKRFSSDC